MLFLLVLVAAYAVTWLLPRRLAGRDRWRLALAGAMVVAGAMHLLEPTPFVQHLPTWVPAREALVLLSGIVEVGLGLALLAPPRVRPVAGALLAVYLVAVFPANVYVAVAGVEIDGQPGGIYPWLRLPFQPLFVWLAWWATREPSAARAPAEVAA